MKKKTQNGRRKTKIIYDFKCDEDEDEDEGEYAEDEDEYEGEYAEDEYEGEDKDEDEDKGEEADLKRKRGARNSIDVEAELFNDEDLVPVDKILKSRY